jgi:hypothetical protein
MQRRYCVCAIIREGRGPGRRRPGPDPCVDAGGSESNSPGIGFGTYHYTYKSGREGDWMLIGLSPRKQSLTLYIMPGCSRYEGSMARLGKYKTGKSCLYIDKLEDVHLPTLKKLIKQSVAHMKKVHG